jgi:hypothetical protein
MIFLKRELSLVTLLFLELILSASSDPTPVIIVHQDWATLITGSVDYAIISSASTADELRKVTAFQNREWLCGICSKLISLSSRCRETYQGSYAREYVEAGPAASHSVWRYESVQIYDNRRKEEGSFREQA